MKIKAIPILLVLLLFISVNAFADKGVFNAKVTPDETFIDTPTTITVTAEVGSENLYISSVRAYEVDENGRPLAYLCRMYDDGTHGDETEADTVFTCQFNVDETAETKFYVRATAAYSRDRNRYLSPNLEINVYEPLPDGLVDDMRADLKMLEDNFLQYLTAMNLEDARQQVFEDALDNPNITYVDIDGADMSLIYGGEISGWVFLSDPDNPIDGAGNSIPTNLPDNYKSPGNDKLLIYAPGYSDASPQNKIADHAKSRFGSAEYMKFDPESPVITKDSSASLGIVDDWGDYGTVIMHTHGGYVTNKAGDKKVVLLTGTEATFWTKLWYHFDLKAGRIGISKDKFYIFPSYITKHSSSMKNTFFYLGACESMKDDSMWNALKGKGAKVGFGWSETVYRSFNTAKFKELINPMLPTSSTTDLLTAKEAFDGIADKSDSHATPAILSMRTASSDWENFVFTEGGLINGDFETGDWTGWTHGGNYDFRIVAGARKHGGSFSGALGRWDTAYHGYDPTSEPYGYEWFYQDFVVPQNVTYLKFYWWMETYDTAVWDWFDVYIKNTSGTTLQTVLYHAGKPGYNYGPYWTTSGWQEVTVDISAYRGQKIRLYFDQRLDGWGDQQRVYVDDVTLE